MKRLTRLSSFISQRRQELGLTQRELGEASNLSNMTIASIEAGYSSEPKIKTLKALSTGLNCSYDKLVEVIEEVKETVIA